MRGISCSVAPCRTPHLLSVHEAFSGRPPTESLLSLGALVAQDLVGRPRTEAGTTKLGKRIAAFVVIAMIPVALGRDVTLWRLIELKMELLIQCVPAFLLAIHWRRLSAGATLAGIFVGTAFSVGLTLADVPRILGVHVGVVGLGLNLAVAIAGSLGRSGRD